MAQRLGRREACGKNATNPHFFAVSRRVAALQKARESRSLGSRLDSPSPSRMHFFRKVRRLDTWSRALLVGFVLAFGLNSIAHAAHWHEPASATTSLHTTACGYCVGFDHLGATPAHPTLHAVVRAGVCAVPLPEAPALVFRPRSSAQPRAPPVLI
jgi:hypothetical protein